VLLDRIVGKNPYKKGSRSPIGPAEGLVLSDIRLHIALVLRKKNPHIFRPDLFENVDLSSEQLKVMADCNAIVKLRYISEQPLPDKRHLQFLIHAADAMAEITDSCLIYDQTAQRLYSKEELAGLLAHDVDATRPQCHVNVLWRDKVTGCYAETFGLRKIGLDELRTGAMEADEQILVKEVMELAIERLWQMTYLPQEVEVEAFDDTFRILLSPPADGVAKARILRMQVA
ncbi:MAG TPA: hypothetical protein VK934_03125, partial [Fimbriimonas sp.]|nr:hypothetical protein [Fimbriimonas sp.]